MGDPTRLGGGPDLTGGHCNHAQLPEAREIAPLPEPWVVPAGEMPERCSECLGSLTHRLCQPLTALRGVIELSLIAEHTKDEYWGALEQSLSLTDRLIQLVVLLREFADSAVVPTLQEHVLFGEVAQEIEEELGDLAASRGVRTVFMATSGLCVLTDPDRLRQTLSKIYETVIGSVSSGAILKFDVSESDRKACLSICTPEFNRPPRGTCRKPDAITPGGIFSQAAKDDGLEWIIIRRLVETLGGTLEMTDHNSQGYHLHIRFPLAEEFSS